MRDITLSVLLSPSAKILSVMEAVIAVVNTLNSKGYNVNIVYHYTDVKDSFMVNGILITTGDDIANRIVDIVINYMVAEYAYSMGWRNFKGAS
ncbi:hypothetical protein ACSU1N_05830 [Thermogladius sp. 4427co]|uniref:hypothetical protein n=1 Tax=Thermogladius sp. 4427co TaxID=3450718 RepID=UPI003F79DFE3